MWWWRINAHRIHIMAAHPVRRRQKKGDAQKQKKAKSWTVVKRGGTSCGCTPLSLSLSLFLPTTHPPRIKRVLHIFRQRTIIMALYFRITFPGLLQRSMHGRSCVQIILVLCQVEIRTDLLFGAMSIAQLGLACLCRKSVAMKSDHIRGYRAGCTICPGTILQLSFLLIG
jgi:hypothetical protein